ncbi:MAB_1171c family putative transporter [Streptomyces pseudogriseolus]|uniref:MAB_1171c family putative transporter n=1 Tax=Streptomyces pseudogriseolus TaxID=36817 RepID=UPI003FA1E6C5
MSLDNLHIPYAVPTLLLAVALVFKAPTLARAWRDADVRATSLLLLLATCVFVSVTPVNIHRINEITGVPNIAAPWTYSLLTAFCATCLTMIMRWREEPSPARDRRMRRVYVIYTGIIVGLWVTFLLADVGQERIYDLDTFYANTPFMREHILLYLVAHMVSALVAAYMIGTWFSAVESRWLKAGLVCLQAGYASGLVFDVAKIVAIGARWNGVDWDFLSTKLAPPFALLDAVLVAVGFIIPQAGPPLQRWISDRRQYQRLYPLWRALRTVEPSSAQARVSRLAALDLRLLQREQHIHDAMLRLAPHYDPDLYARQYRTARVLLGDEKRARGIAGAAAIRAAVASFDGRTPRTTTGQPVIGPEITEHIEAISMAMRRRPRRAVHRPQVQSGDLAVTSNAESNR